MKTQRKGQALNPARPGPAQPGPARPTSLKTVPARPKIRPNQEDVKSQRWLIKGDWRLLLRNYVGVRRRPEHAPSNLATTVNDMGVDPEVGGPGLCCADATVLISDQLEADSVLHQSIPFLLHWA